MAKINSPNKDYCGVSASVTFINGVGETDNPRLIKWFKDKGYEVEDEAVKAQEEIEALKAYALEKGIDIGKASTKEGIQKKIDEAEREQDNLDSQEASE